MNNLINMRITVTEGNGLFTAKLITGEDTILDYVIGSSEFRAVESLLAHSLVIGDLVGWNHGNVVHA